MPLCMCMHPYLHPHPPVPMPMPVPVSLLVYTQLDELRAEVRRLNGQLNALGEAADGNGAALLAEELESDDKAAL